MIGHDTQTLRKLGDADRQRLAEIISRNTERLWRARGFVGARPGFAVRHGALQREPAIVAFVRVKIAEDYLDGCEELPSELEGIPVDVVVADPHTELELRTGQAGIDPVSISFAEPTYEGLPGDPIDASFDVERPLLCHVGPDSGWVVLRDFVGQTRESVTAAIYDFSGDHIANTLIDASRAHGFPIKLAIDDGINETEELPIQRRLKRRLQDNYDAEIVMCRSGARFPTAYHEKVAVRDGRSFWLSSGNWTRSSQPEIDPIGNPDEASGMYSKGNREWHVVIEDDELSQLFARYIEHDRTTASEDAGGAFAETMLYPDVFVPLDGLLAETEAAALAPPVPVAPQPLPATPGTIRIQPVLSPDNYATRVRELIESATRRLYLQYSYITWTSADRDRAFREVLEHLAELSWRDPAAFDLRIIVNSRDAAQKVRVLAENGFNEAVFRRQSRVHNKGIVVDGERVLVSSQNWSGDGFLRNRDAGVIVHNRQIAEYYEAVFLDDWNKRGRPPFGDGLTAILARPGDVAPPGMVRMSWREYFGD
jgi:phosphatidylserine/phosphatidylglycerophosphate/cardiolipin synthase-like enzyme